MARAPPQYTHGNLLDPLRVAVKIRFVVPSLAKQAGGIQNAVEGLREALQQRGIAVLEGGDPSDVGAVHHFHGLWDRTHSKLAARLYKMERPYVVSPHGMLEPWSLRNRRWKKLPYLWLIERRFLMNAQSLFVTSQMEADHLKQIVQHPRIEVLPLGCRDPRRPDFESARTSLQWSPRESVMLFLSRIHPKKGLDLLLHALARSSAGWQDWKLVVVGDGDSNYMASLKKLASRLGNRLPRIEWVGPIWGEDRWKYLQGADLFCLPTHSENFGIAVLESLHVGTPVMTTDQTPWRGNAGEEGFFIVSPDVDSIAAGMTRALDRLKNGWTRSNRQRLATWAETHFSWETLTGNYIEAYKAAVSEEFPGFGP
jgi:glycosyltransferase involved in cell wall biosynthesis